jgi:hypothetical protein
LTSASLLMVPLRSTRCSSWVRATGRSVEREPLIHCIGLVIAWRGWELFERETSVFHPSSSSVVSSLESGYSPTVTNYWLINEVDIRGVWIGAQLTAWASVLSYRATDNRPRSLLRSDNHQPHLDRGARQPAMYSPTRMVLNCGAVQLTSLFAPSPIRSPSGRADRR